MSGIVAVPCRPDSARYVDFYRSLTELVLPNNWKVKIYPGFFPDYAINQAVDDVLQQKLEWLFIVDDDMIIPPDTLTKLLAAEESIIGCNLLMRQAPFNPYIFHATKENGEAFPDIFGDKPPGVIEVASISTGGLLIHYNVLRVMNKPCFATNEFLNTYDLYFCHQARSYGWKIWCDLRAACGHIVNAVVWPDRVNGQWATSLVIGQSFKIPLPAATIRDEKLVMSNGQTQS